MTGPKGSAGAQGSTGNNFNSSTLSTDEQFYYEYLKNFSKKDLDKAQQQLEQGDGCGVELCSFLGDYDDKTLLKILRLKKNNEKTDPLHKGSLARFQNSKKFKVGNTPLTGPQATFSKESNPVATKLFQNLVKLGVRPEEIDGSGKGLWAAKDKELCPQELYAFVENNLHEKSVQKALKRSEIRLPRAKKYQGMGFAEKMAQYHIGRAARLSGRGALRYRKAIRGNLQWATYYQPNNADNHHLLAGQYLIEKKFDLAIQSYQSAYLADPTADRKKWVGHAQYAKGDFQAARKIYSDLLITKPKDADLLRLRIETNQALLKGYTQSKKLDDKSTHKKIEMVTGELHIDMAKLKALTVDEERKSLQKLKGVLAQAHGLSGKKKQDLIQKVLLLGKSYQDLSFANFSDPKDAEWVRKELNGLSQETFALLIEFSANDADPKIKAQVPLFKGMSLLAEGKINEAVKEFELARKSSPMADTILTQLESQKVRMKNLAAVEILKSYNKEGSRLMEDDARGVLGHTVGFIDSLVRSDGKTMFHDMAKNWRIRGQVVSEIERRIVKGEANTIYEALLQIKADPKLDSEVKDCAVKEYLNASQISYYDQGDPKKAQEEFTGEGTYGVTRGRIIGQVIDFASAKNPHPDLARDLLQRSFELEADNNAVQTPFAAYALVDAFAPNAKIKARASENMEALKGNSSIARAALKLAYQTSPEELAIDVLLMFASAGLGNLAKLAALKKLEQAGVTGYKALAIAGGTGFMVEATTLWGLNTGKEAIKSDVSKVFSQDHLLKSYGSTLLMIGFLKGFGKLGQGIAPKAVKSLGLLKNGKLTAGGNALQWMIGHGSGLTGMIASSKTSQAIGLAEAPPGGWKESLVHDVLGYAQFAIAHKVADGMLGGKLTKVGQKHHNQIAVKETTLLSKAHADSLGFAKAPQETRNWVVYLLTRAKLTHPDFSSRELVKLYKKGDFKSLQDLLVEYQIPLGINEKGKFFERDPQNTGKSFHESLGVPKPETQEETHKKKTETDSEVHEVTPDMIVSIAPAKLGPHKEVTRIEGNYTALKLEQKTKAGPKPEKPKAVEKPFQKFFDEAARSEKGTVPGKKVVALKPENPPAASGGEGTAPAIPRAALAARKKLNSGPKDINLGEILPQKAMPKADKALKPEPASLKNSQFALDIQFKKDANRVYLKENDASGKLEVSDSAKDSVAELVFSHTGKYILRPIGESKLGVYRANQRVPISSSEGIHLESGMLLRIGKHTLKWALVSKKPNPKILKWAIDEQYNRWLKKIDNGRRVSSKGTDGAPVVKGLNEIAESWRFSHDGKENENILLPQASLPNQFHSPLRGWTVYPKDAKVRSLIEQGHALSELPMPTYQLEVRGEQRLAELKIRLQQAYGDRLKLASSQGEKTTYWLKDSAGDKVFKIEIQALAYKKVSVSEAKDTIATFNKDSREILKSWWKDGAERSSYAYRVLKLFRDYNPDKLIKIIQDPKATALQKARASEDLAMVTAYLKDVPFMREHLQLGKRLQNEDIPNVFGWAFSQKTGLDNQGLKMWALYKEAKKDFIKLDELSDQVLRSEAGAAEKYQKLHGELNKKLKALEDFKTKHYPQYLFAEYRAQYEKLLKEFSGLDVSALQPAIDQALANKKNDLKGQFIRKVGQEASVLPRQWAPTLKEFQEVGRKYFLEGDRRQKTRFEAVYHQFQILVKRVRTLKGISYSPQKFKADPSGAATNPGRPNSLGGKKGPGTAGILATFLGLETFLDSKAAYAADGVTHASDALLTGGVAALGIAALSAAGFFGYRWLKSRSAANKTLLSPAEIQHLGMMGIREIQLPKDKQSPEYSFALGQLLNKLICVHNPDASTHALIKKVVQEMKQTSDPSWLTRRLADYGRKADGSPMVTVSLTETEAGYLGVSVQDSLLPMDVVQRVIQRSQVGPKAPGGYAFVPTPTGRALLKKMLEQYGPQLKSAEPKLHAYLEGLFRQVLTGRSVLKAEGDPKVIKPATFVRQQTEAPKSKISALPETNFIPLDKIPEQAEAVEIYLSGNDQPANPKGTVPQIILPDPLRTATSDPSLVGVLYQANGKWFVSPQGELKVLDAQGGAKNLELGKGSLQLVKGDSLKIGFYTLEFDGKQLRPRESVPIKTYFPKSLQKLVEKGASTPDRDRAGQATLLIDLNKVGQSTELSLGKNRDPIDLGAIAANRHEGIGYKAVNEDRVVVLPFSDGTVRYIAIDGMGGYVGGERAAAIAERVFKEHGSDLNLSLKDLIHKADQAIKDDPEIIKIYQQTHKMPGAVAIAVEVKPLEDGRYSAKFARVGDAEAIVLKPTSTDTSGNPSNFVVHEGLGSTPHERGMTLEIMILPFANMVDQALGGHYLRDTNRLEINESSMILEKGTEIYVGSDGWSENFGRKSDMAKVRNRSHLKTAAQSQREMMNEALIQMELIRIRKDSGQEELTLTRDIYEQAYGAVWGHKPVNQNPWTYEGMVLRKNGSVWDPKKPRATKPVGHFKKDNISLIVHQVGGEIKTD